MRFWEEVEDQFFGALGLDFVEPLLERIHLADQLLFTLFSLCASDDLRLTASRTTFAGRVSRRVTSDMGS